MWDVVVTGVVGSKNRDRVIERASSRLKSSPENIEKILASAPTVVKAGLEKAVADKYVSSLMELGLAAEAREQPGQASTPTPEISSKRRKPAKPSIAILALSLVFSATAAIWVYDRLAKLEHSLQTAHKFESDFQTLTIDPIAACAGPDSGALEWDIADYSYNVIEDPHDKIYRYQSNLEDAHNREVHVIGTGHGTGRIAVGETSKPVILYLVSGGYSRWFVELSQNAHLDKIIAHPRVTEINISRVSRPSTWESLQHLAGRPITSPEEIPVYQISERAKCGNFTPGFQVDRRLESAKKRSLFLKNVLGQRETSLQLTYGESSYYTQTFHIPIERSKVSSQKYERVYHAARSTRKEHRKPTEREQADERLMALRKMQRLPGIVADQSIQTVDQLLDVVKRYQDKKLLPDHIPPSAIHGKKDVLEWFDIQSFRSAEVLYSRATEKRIDCNTMDRLTTKKLAILGDSGNNKVDCARGNQVYALADGEDTVDDAWGDDLIDAGPGNDMIDAGWGNDILYFSYGWGEDVVDKTCSWARFHRKDTASSPRYYWDDKWEFKNFIVFGPGIHRDDIVDLGNKLVNQKTGDSISFKSRCFNLVFDEEAAR